ncbi:MAG: DUF420 domain-containing protein [Magnetospirillum sp.]|nr:DUF420 domain-containing protein [Magnetospirillum sp.]
MLPHLTAALNALSLGFLLFGWRMIRTGRKHRHRKAMMAAVGVGALFLLAYLLHHLTAPIFVFRGEGPIRRAYYALLISHVALAATLAPMVALTLHHALAYRFDRHRSLARRVLPMWIYVSVSGLLVYALLYHVYT